MEQDPMEKENPEESLLRDSSEKGTRTPDRADMSRLLYQLSYLAIRCLGNNETLAECWMNIKYLDSTAETFNSSFTCKSKCKCEEVRIRIYICK